MNDTDSRHGDITPTQAIVFVSAYMGGNHGTAKSARDFLRAVLAAHSNVMVVSPTREDFPSQLCGYSLARPVWLQVPQPVPSGAQKNLRSRIAESIKDRFIRHRLARDAGKAPVIVNGWASFEYWQSVRSCFSGRKALIVRESPRHFSGPDLERPLSEIETIFSQFDHLIFVSENSKNEWMGRSLLSNIPYSVLPNCCEEEEAVACMSLDRNILRTKYRFAAKDFVVLCPGFICHRKGQDLLLKIIPQLLEKIPELKIVFVGDACDEFGKNVQRNIPIGPRVIRYSTQPAIIDLLRAADLLVFPSRAEAMPRTVLEAMAVQTPIVASDVDGIPEIINHERTGLLFPSNDHEGLYQGIIRMYENPEQRDLFSKSGYAIYWEQYSRMQQFRKMRGIIDTLLLDY